MPDLSGRMVRFETPRLSVRAAGDQDAPFIASLWSDPRVMRLVGFPQGIPTAEADVPRHIRRAEGLAALLLVENRASRTPIGQCMLGEPDREGASEPDIKLHPAFWGRGYGRELWAAIIDELFVRSSCTVVRGTPNVANLASIRMQESAGMRRMGEGLSEFPASMSAFTEPVPHYIYEITRTNWLEQRAVRWVRRA
jgi:RimJ/RimL family protein N-acetyltransferase